jgi:hypothetical protein
LEKQRQNNPLSSSKKTQIHPIKRNEAMHTHSDHDEDFYEESDFYTCIRSHTVYESPVLFDKVPEGFTAVTIPLHARMSATLDWSAALDKARTWQKKGLKLLFDLDLGLFHHLDHPLDSKTQFSSLRLAVQELQKHISAEFKEATLGVIVARSTLLPPPELALSQTGTLQFEEWLQEHKCISSTETKALFWHAVIADYLELLTEDLEESVAPLLLVDCQGAASFPLLFARVTHKNPSDRVKIALKNPLFMQNTPIWQTGKDSSGYIGCDLTSYNQNLQSEKTPQIGVVFPQVIDPEEDKEAFLGLEDTLISLLKKDEPFKILSEEFLTSEWEGLDTLIVTPLVQKRSVRKLKGFEAAGGHIISTTT